MSSSTRAGRLTAAAVILALLIAVPAAIAAADSPARAGKSVASNKQLKKVSKQLKKLRKKVRALEAAGVEGPRGPEGPQGPVGPTGALGGPAGGDLIGTYPNPEIGPDVIGQPELAANSVSAPEIVSNSVGSAKIPDNAITGSEIANGTVGQIDLATVTKRVSTTSDLTDTTAGDGTGGSVSFEISCLIGEQMLSAGGEFLVSTVGANVQVSSVRPDLTTVPHSATVGGYNDSGAPRDFRAWVLCLAP